MIAKCRDLHVPGADMPGFEGALGNQNIIVHGNDVSSQTVTLGLKFDF